MLVTLREVLPEARKNGYAVGLFNTVNLEMARGVLAAAEEEKSPVIIGTAEILLPFGPMEQLASLLVPMAEKSSVPVVLHFDHGLTADRVRQALQFGFTSVMYDCSMLPYQENAAACREMARYAHSMGATIEVELGHVGDGVGEEDAYTDPNDAAHFAEQTGADALAVAIGTAHGPYRKQPKLDLARLECIAAATPVPLVLHGGSGLSGEDFRSCIEKGISKINIFTDINQAMARAAYDTYTAQCGMTDLIPGMVEAAKKAAAAKMRLFKSSNRV